MSIDVNGRRATVDEILAGIPQVTYWRMKPNVRHRAFSYKELSPTRGFCIECGERR
jgi:hypothetical protein